MAVMTSGRNYNYILLILTGLVFTIGRYFVFADAAVAAETEPPVRCRFSNVKGLIVEDCSHLALRRIPLNIRSNTEVLDLSYNVIITIENDSFKSSTDIKLLYLQSSRLETIERNAFAVLTNLIVLDLSNNRLWELPYIPPSLKKLFLRNTFIFQNKEESFPSLEHLNKLDTLDLAINSMDRFPHLGKSSSLLELNISLNHIKFISVNDLAGLCGLKYLHFDAEEISQSSQNPEELCSCVELKNWTREHNIVGSQLTCKSKNDGQCEALKNWSEAYRRYEQCVCDGKGRVQSYILMTTIGAVVGALLCCLYLYTWYRKRKTSAILRPPIPNVDTAELPDPNFKICHIRGEKCATPEEIVPLSKKNISSPNRS